MFGLNAILSAASWWNGNAISWHETLLQHNGSATSVSITRKLVLVLPPMRKEVDQLYTHIHAFSLMTYDYSSVHRPGAHAPLYWIRRTSEKLIPTNSRDFNEKHQKILLGINMHGNDLTPL
uniref:GH18 domain-containing protein n=1 Tax=Glossina palpalis gambiensis TaxID=67801 RepID=A0A1B0C339_9MUSC